MNRTMPATTARSVRGNAALIQLECQTTLGPACARHPELELDYLIQVLEHVRRLQIEGTPTTHPDDYHALAETLATAITSARAALAAQDSGPGAPPHRAMIQVLAKCETRARRIILLQEPPPQTNS